MPLVLVSAENSALICGDIVLDVIDMVGYKHSFMKNYRKKVALLIDKYSSFIIRIVMNLHTMHKESGQIFQAARVRIRRKMTREKLIIIKIITFLMSCVKEVPKLNFQNMLSEAPIDVLFTWFCDH